jgi:RNA polymerase sigma-70 factor (ECF subfamily)
MDTNDPWSASGEAELIRATLDGDRAAFGALVERYWNMAFALALSKNADPTEAEDIAQESFLAAYSYLDRLKDPTRFAGWLSTIVSHRTVDAIRRRSRRNAALGNRTDDLEAVPARSSNPGLTESQVRFVRQTVDRLPEKFRQLIIMRFVGGLSSNQIAEQVGKRSGTVRVWLHRAYKVLRRDLSSLLVEAES